jgi:hypothetical protein
MSDEITCRQSSVNIPFGRSISVAFSALGFTRFAVTNTAFLEGELAVIFHAKSSAAAVTLSAGVT